MKKNFIMAIILILTLAGVALLLFKTSPSHRTLRIGWANIKQFTGVIESISFGNSTQNTGISIIAPDKARHRLFSFVTASTKIFEADGKPSSIRNLKKGDRIKERYVRTNAGENEAKYIQKLKR